MWAMGLAIAVNLTDNPWQLLGIDLAAVAVTVARRGLEPWARALRLYIAMAGVIVVIRLFFAVGFSGTVTGTTLFTLPQIDLPDWMAGIRIGGPVSAQVVSASVADGLQLASMFICVGAAMSLADPRRALRSVPPALYELSVSVVVALTMAPQLVESIARIRRAQRLRGELPKGIRQLVRIGVPALEDAVNRSLSLAAGMESRGFGRTGERRRSPLTPVLLMTACATIPIGAYLALANMHAGLGALLVIGGVTAAGIGVHVAGRGVIVTRYRPDPWRAPEWGMVACGPGVAVIVGILVKAFPAWTVNPTDHPVPLFDPLMVGVAGMVALPLLFTSPTASPAGLPVTDTTWITHDVRRLRGQEVPC